MSHTTFPAVHAANDDRFFLDNGHSIRRYESILNRAGYPAPIDVGVPCDRVLISYSLGDAC
jgi:hypothetical protein